jgi:hypothetical protein
MAITLLPGRQAQRLGLGSQPFGFGTALLDQLAYLLSGGPHFLLGRPDVLRGGTAAFGQVTEFLARVPPLFGDDPTVFGGNAPRFRPGPAVAVQSAEVHMTLQRAFLPTTLLGDLRLPVDATPARILSKPVV